MTKALQTDKQTTIASPPRAPRGRPRGSRSRGRPPSSAARAPGRRLGRPPKAAVEAGSHGADDEGAPKRRRPYVKRKPKPQPPLDPGARVFFSNRLDAHAADTGRFIPKDEDRLAYEEAQTKAGLIEAGETGVQPIVDPSTPSTPSVGSGVGYQVKKIRIGGYEIDSWYISPYPEEYSRHSLLYICEFCLKYIKSEYTYKRHCLKCPLRHPPGDEIYRDGNLSVFEVDGRKNKIYCQNLCLIGKMFLDTKTLYYDVEPFLFYILCEYDQFGYHFAGYYSKEKRSAQGYNLSCIMILPSKQREGYGKLMIEFSYLLSKKEGVPGSPEKPLSDFGLLSYRSYWRRAVYEILLDPDSLPESGAISIANISQRTGMTPDDIVSTLQTDGMLQRAPGSSGAYTIVADVAKLEEYVGRAQQKNPRRIDPEKLRWTPFLTKSMPPPLPGALSDNSKADSEDDTVSTSSELSV